MATSFEVNSFDNRLYFEMEDADEDDPSILVGGMEVSITEAREILDSKIKRLARNIEDNDSSLTLPEISAIGGVKLATVKKYSSFKHFFRARTLSGRQRLGWSGKRSAGGGPGRAGELGPETGANSTTLARSKSLNASLCSRMESTDDEGVTSFLSPPSSSTLVRRNRLSSYPSPQTSPLRNRTPSRPNVVTGVSGGVSRRLATHGGIHHGDVIVKTRSLPNKFSDSAKSTLDGQVSSRSYVNLPPMTSPGRIPSGLPPIPPGRTKPDDVILGSDVHDNAPTDRGSSPIPSRGGGGTCKRRITRNYILHRHCNLATSKSPLMDVAILYSSRCPVSAQWASYIQRIVTASATIKDQCKNNIQVTIQCVEFFSDLVGNDTYTSRKRLNFLEESVAHARVQVVLLSQAFLDWIVSNSSLVVGNLLPNSSKVIGLLLGIERSEILLEHRSPLLTFSTWYSTMEVKPETGSDPKGSLSNISLQLHRSAVEILHNAETVKGGSSKRIPEKSYQVWPQSVTLVKPASRMLLLLSPQSLITPEDVCEVTFISSGEVAKKVSALCKLLNSTTLEVVVPQIILGNCLTKRCNVNLSVNGEPWTTKSNQVEVRISTSEGLKYFDTALAEMVAKCLPVEIFKDTEGAKDPELPSLIHWAAKIGLPKMTQALMTFPLCQEAAGRLNSQLLNASELAHRHGHLEVAHLLRPYGNHNYEYPDLPARPPSDSAISLNEKCQSFLNCKNFETNGSVTGSKPEEHSPRRISDPGTCRPSAKTVESVSFEGPLSGNLSRTTDPLPLYDVPRILDNCYDVPPRPVPVVISPDGSVPDKPKTSSYVPMQPRCNSQPSYMPSTNKFLSGDASSSLSKSSDETATLRPQSRGEVLSEIFGRNSPASEMIILNTDKDIIDLRSSPPISAFDPVSFSDYEKTSSKNFTTSARKASTSMGSLADEDKIYCPIPTRSKSPKPDSFNASKDTAKDSESSGRSTPFGNLLKKSLISVSGTLKRKKKTSISSASKISLATPEKSQDSKWKSEVNEEPSPMSNYFRKRSFSSFTPETSDPVVPDLKPVDTKQSPESESATDMFANDSDSLSHSVESQNPAEILLTSGEYPDQTNSDDVIALPAKSRPEIFEGPETETRQPLYDVPRKLNFDTVDNNSESSEQQDQQFCRQIVCILDPNDGEMSSNGLNREKVQNVNAGAYENVIIRTSK